MARQKHTFNPTQSISLTISITGEQAVQVDSHGGRERGSNVVAPRRTKDRQWHSLPLRAVLSSKVRKFEHFQSGEADVRFKSNNT